MQAPARPEQALPAGPWSEGWWAHARRVASPNFGPRPPGLAGQVCLVVLHSISLPPGCYGGPEVEQLFTNTLDWDAHPYFDGIRRKFCGLEGERHGSALSLIKRLPWRPLA